MDIVDCSSGGVAPRYAYPSSYGYQVPYAQKVRSEAGIGTAAVGLIVNGRQAEAIVASGQADLVAIGREALADPNFALHAQAELGAVDPEAPFASWPTQVAWWLQGRATDQGSQRAVLSGSVIGLRPLRNRTFFQEQRK